jgi:hypothetical protein
MSCCAKENAASKRKPWLLQENRANLPGFSLQHCDFFPTL